MWLCLTLNSSRDRKAQIKRPPFCLVDPADAPLAQSAIQSEPLFILGRAARAYWHIGIRPMGASAPPVTSPSSCWVALADSGKSLTACTGLDSAEALTTTVHLRTSALHTHCNQQTLGCNHFHMFLFCFCSFTYFLYHVFLNPFIILQGITYQ